MARQTGNDTNDTEKQATSEHSPSKHSTAPSSWGWWVAGGLAVVLIAAFIAFVATVNYRHNRIERVGNPDYGFMGPRMMGGRFGGNYEFNNNGTAQNRLTGVVTAVNGSSFTLAGNGATTKVTTSSSTQYYGGSQVKVNDTVTAWGTLSSNTLSASQIEINP